MTFDLFCVTIICLYLQAKYHPSDLMMMIESIKLIDLRKILNFCRKRIGFSRVRKYDLIRFNSTRLSIMIFHFLPGYCCFRICIDQVWWSLSWSTSKPGWFFMMMIEEENRLSIEKRWLFFGCIWSIGHSPSKKWAKLNWKKQVEFSKWIEVVLLYKSFSRCLHFQLIGWFCFAQMKSILDLLGWQSIRPQQWWCEILGGLEQ